MPPAPPARGGGKRRRRGGSGRAQPGERELDHDAALKKFRAGRVVYEKAPSGNTQSYNPDRRQRRAISVHLGITTGRQWKRFKRALRREQKARAEARS